MSETSLETLYCDQGVEVVLAVNSEGKTNFKASDAQLEFANSLENAGKTKIILSAHSTVFGLTDEN